MAETRASTREAFLTTGPGKEAAISLRRRGRLVGKSKVPQIPLLPWAREHKTPHSPTKPSPSSPPSKAIKLKGSFSRTSCCLTTLTLGCIARTNRLRYCVVEAAFTRARKRQMRNKQKEKNLHLFLYEK